MRRSPVADAGIEPLGHLECLVKRPDCRRLGSAFIERWSSTFADSLRRPRKGDSGGLDSQEETSTPAQAASKRGYVRHKRCASNTASARRSCCAASPSIRPRTNDTSGLRQKAFDQGVAISACHHGAASRLVWRSRCSRKPSGVWRTASLDPRASDASNPHQRSFGDRVGRCHCEVPHQVAFGTILS